MRVILLVGLIAIVGALSWRFIPRPQPERPSKVQAQPEVVAMPGWERVKPNARMQQRAYVKTQLIRLFDGEFAELEKEAATPSFPGVEINGLSPDEAFYACFSYSEWNDNPEWERFFAQLDKWDVAHPNSPHAGLARALAFISYAWDARGTGWADSVTEEGWRLYGERLQVAAKALKGSEANGGPNYPAYWKARITLARAQNVPAADTLEFAETALNRFPEDASLYSGVCVYLLPRWHGAPGQWESWLKMQATHRRWGEAGMPPRLYARIVWRLCRQLYDEPIFTNESLLWPKTLEGLDELCAAYPESTYWRTARARLASVAHDKDAFLRAARSMNRSFDTWAFHSKNFEHALDWADPTKTVSR